MKCHKKRLSSASAAAFAVLAIGSAGAFAGGSPPNIEFDQNVTPNVIFGTGNANGGFTTDRRNGIEIGIRAKIPFVGTLNSNGDGTYSYTLAETGEEPAAATLKPRRWNFDWSVNTDFDGSSGLFIDDLTYELGMDADPGPGTDFLKFDPIIPTVTVFDHDFGDNSTLPDAGDVAVSQADYVLKTATKNVVQQSWRYSFFPYPPLNLYDPDIPGTYAVYLLARNSDGEVVARTDIQVLIGGAQAVTRPANKKDCKNGGWATFYPAFDSEKDCKKFVKNAKDEDHDDDDD